MLSDILHHQSNFFQYLFLLKLIFIVIKSCPKGQLSIQYLNTNRVRLTNQTWLLLLKVQLGIRNCIASASLRAPKPLIYKVHGLD